MKTPDCHPPVHPAEIFSWRARVGTAEASDLGPVGARLHDRIWTDAADVGFIARNERTGATQLFTLARIEKRDGEVIAWHYAQHDPAQPGCGRHMTITIFND